MAISHKLGSDSELLKKSAIGAEKGGAGEL